MKVTIHQPDFLPWIGYFHKWMSSDLLIIYDDAQFIKGGWQNRDKININGRERWITVPVLTKRRFGQLIKNVEINYQNDWKREHLNTLKTYYGKTKNFKKIYTKLEIIYNKNHKTLLNLNMDLLYMIAEILRIKTATVYSSEYNITTSGTEKLVALLKAVKANFYLTGLGSKNYLEEAFFTEANIAIHYQTIDEIKKDISIKDEQIGYSVIDYLFRNL